MNNRRFTILDETFKQPSYIGDHFGAFVQRQYQRGANMEHKSGAKIRIETTDERTLEPIMLFKGRSLWAGVSFSASGPVKSLDLWTKRHPDDKNTRHYVSYHTVPNLGGLVVARETTNKAERRPGTEVPQALSALLGHREPFERGAIDYGDGDKHLDIIGEQEFKALGRILVGHNM